jgi:ADP-heptose:LPS heptosyltransferase
MVATQIPNAEIHYVTKQPFTSLVEYNTYISKIHVFTDNLHQLVLKLKQENFDYIVDLHNNIRSGRLRRKLGVKSFVYHKYSFEKWLYSTFRIDRLPRTHVVEKFLQAVAALNIRDDGKGLDYYFPPDIKQPLLPEGFITSGYFVIALGAAHKGKQCPAAKHLEYISRVEGNFVLIGGANDNALADEIMTGFTGKKTSAKVINMCGKTNLHESAVIIKNCTTLITNDSGMMHIGAALGKKIISLWGQTIPEFGMYPYKSAAGSVILQPEMSRRKRKISKLGNKSVGNLHDMMHISAIRIVEALQHPG